MKITCPIFEYFRRNSHLEGESVKLLGCGLPPPSPHVLDALLAPSSLPPPIPSLHFSVQIRPILRKRGAFLCQALWKGSFFSCSFLKASTAKARHVKRQAQIIAMWRRYRRRQKYRVTHMRLCTLKILLFFQIDSKISQGFYAVVL